jgi:ABC-type microcin C transport system permease subunit YejB
MAKKALPNNLLGIILVVVGAGLGYWGFQKSEGLQSQLSTAITGSHTDNVMLLYIGAAVCVAIGAFLLIKK